MIDFPDYILAEPIHWLRAVNALVSAVFAPLIWYVVCVSRHGSSALYRYGMMFISAGLMCNLLMAIGMLPVNVELWMLKDFGIYMAALAIALDYWRERSK